MSKAFIVVPEDLLLLLQRKPTQEKKPYSKGMIDANLSAHNKKAERKTKENRTFAQCRARINH